jgi:serine/threonine protein phosphatase PrpC
MLSETTVGTSLNAAGTSHPGRVRPRNEDRFHVDAARGIFIVVDGVGGHAGGERAAEIAVEAVRTRLERDTGSLVDRLREAIASANEGIHDESIARPELSGMCCVLTVAVVNGGRVCAGHVGDTRLYKLRHGELVKLTHDHSPVGAMEDAGRLAEREAMDHPRRHEVWRDVGTAARRPAEPEFVEIVEEPFEPDAALLLCSDGLTDRVSSADIAAIMQARAGSPDIAVQDLIWAANDAGGRDNVTAVVIEGPDFAASASPAARNRTGQALWAAVRYSLAVALGVAIAAVAMRLPFMRVEVPTPQSVYQSPVLSQARTWRVGSSAGADATSIEAAIAAARPGDLVIVERGTYRESITLREGVAVVSSERHGAELRRPVDLAGPWTAIIATGITSGSIRGLHIVGTDAERLDVGVFVHDAVASLEDLQVSGARDSAVRITGASTVTVNADAEPAPLRAPQPVR